MKIKHYYFIINFSLFHIDKLYIWICKIDELKQPNLIFKYGHFYNLTDKQKQLLCNIILNFINFLNQKYRYSSSTRRIRSYLIKVNSNSENKNIKDAIDYIFFILTEEIEERLEKHYTIELKEMDESEIKEFHNFALRYRNFLKKLGL